MIDHNLAKGVICGIFSLWRVILLRNCWDLIILIWLAFCSHCSALAGMDGNGIKQPLLPGAPNVMPKSNVKGNPKRRRFRRCRSAPLAEFVPRNVGETTLPRPKSILDNLHPSIKKVGIVLFLYLILGTICFYLVRNQLSGKKTNGVLDSVYFCIVTMTTVGYGDLVPNSTATKLLACGFVFSGMALVGLVLSKGADYIVEKQEVILVRTLNMHRKVGQTELLKEIETNKVRYKCVVAFIILSVSLVVGTIFLVNVEKLDIVDAFYCVCSTVTTLGYGDKSFSTKAGRVFAIFWILSSTLCLAQFFLYIAELNIENRQKELVKWVLTRRMTNVDLEAADFDDDGVVG